MAFIETNNGNRTVQIVRLKMLPVAKHGCVGSTIGDTIIPAIAYNRGDDSIVGFRSRHANSIGRAGRDRTAKPVSRMTLFIGFMRRHFMELGHLSIICFSTRLLKASAKVVAASTSSSES